MKKTFILLALAVSVLASCQDSKTAIDSKMDSISYLMGAGDGQRLEQGFKQQKFDSILNLDLYFKGIKDATNKEAKLDYEVSDKLEMVQNFFRTYQQNQMEIMQDTTGTVKPIVFEKAKIDSVSYIMGASDGKGMLDGFKQAGLDTIVSFNLYF